jgi:hypothetical protein
MEELDGVLFGTFTLREVDDLYKSETSSLEFGWLRKKTNNNCLHNSLLKTPEKLTPRCYNLGGASPNLPRNPPTTPVSELNSRGASPCPVGPLSKLNANAPPFIPCSSPEPGDETLGTEQGHSSALEERLTTPTNQNSPSPGSEVAEESSTPVQTVAMPTPSLPSIAGGGVSVNETRTDAPPTSHSASPHSSTQESPSSHPHSSPPPPHSTPSTQSTTPSSQTHPKTWASVVRKIGSGSQSVATPSSSADPSEGKERGGRGGGGEVGENGGSESSGTKPSVHLKSLGDQLEGLKVSHAPLSLQPRGLINQGNWCYMHAVSFVM